MKRDPNARWTGQRYSFRPHDAARAQLRRLRQIVHGQLQVSAETREEAWATVLELDAMMWETRELGVPTPDAQPDTDPTPASPPPEPPSTSA